MTKNFTQNSPIFSKTYAVFICLFLIIAMTVMQTVFAWLFGRMAGLDLLQSSENGHIVSLSVMVSAVLLVVMIYGIFEHKTARAWDFLGLVAPIWRRFWWCLGCLGVFLVVSEALSYALNRNPTDFMDSLMLGDGRFLLVLATVIIAPIYEEIVFRGAIFTSIQNAWQSSKYATLIASLISSTLFAVTHLQYEWFEMAVVFGLGLLFCYTKIRCRSLIAPMILHFINNALAMAMYWYGV